MTTNSSAKHFKLLLLHRVFPLPLETLSERYASPLPLRSTRVVSSYSSNFPPSLRPRLKSCSHHSSNLSMARLTTGSLAWADESTCDGDHARCTCRLSSNADFMRSIWQRYNPLATDGDTMPLVHAPSPSYPPSRHVPPCSAHT